MNYGLGELASVSFLKEKKKQTIGFQGNYFLCVNKRVGWWGWMCVCVVLRDVLMGCVWRSLSRVWGVGVCEFWTNGIFCVLILTSMRIHAVVLSYNGYGYSVILTTSFYDMNQKTSTKKLISKISVGSNFAFASYAICMIYAVFHCSVRYVFT